MWVADNPHQHKGKVIDTGHCVRYVQVAANVPHTSQWRKGQQVRGGNIPRHAVIATFGADGRYENKTDGSSHAAIFLYEDKDGLRVLDQWQGHPVAERTIHFRDGEGKKVNDGSAFYVVESA